MRVGMLVGSKLTENGDWDGDCWQFHKGGRVESTEYRAELGALGEMGALTLVMVRVIWVQGSMRLSLPLKVLAPQIWMMIVVPLTNMPKLPPAEKIPK